MSGRKSSSIHYAKVSSICTHTYGRLSATYDLVVMRLRLGYRYYWEVSGADPVPYRLLARPGGHTLKHYVLQCPCHGLKLISPRQYWERHATLCSRGRDPEKFLRRHASRHTLFSHTRKTLKGERRMLQPSGAAVDKSRETSACFDKSVAAKSSAGNNCGRHEPQS